MIHLYNNNTNYNHFDILQEARQDLMGEIEAVMQYDNHIRNTQNMVAKNTWTDIRDEELVHLGQLFAMVLYLDPSQKALIEKGMKEFDDRLMKK